MAFTSTAVATRNMSPGRARRRRGFTRAPRKARAGRALPFAAEIAPGQSLSRNIPVRLGEKSSAAQGLDVRFPPYSGAGRNLRHAQRTTACGPAFEAESKQNIRKPIMHKPLLGFTVLLFSGTIAVAQP